MEKYVLLLLYANTLQGLELCSTTAFDDKDQKICAYSEGYDQYVNPDFPKPTQVQIDIVVRSVLSVDENSQLLELVAYSNLRWFDPRLDLNDGTIQRIRPSKAEYGDLWKTSIHYSNVVTNTNRGNKPYAYKNSSNSGLTTGLWIEKVLLNKAVISCRMDFSNFPFDSHICNWKIRAVDTMNVTILNIDSIQQETKNELTATVSQPIPVETTNLPYDIYVSPGAKGVEMVQREETSFILVKFSFARNKNGKLELISGYFIPTVLFAFLSLVSYLIKPEIVPGRMGMLVILFLILTTIHGNVKAPSSRGFSYLEVWYSGMFLPVIVAIIEYALILATLKYKSESQYMTRFLAQVDIIFLCCNATFLVVFILAFFLTIPS